MCDYEQKKLSGVGVSGVAVKLSLEDKFAISELLARYSHAVDSRDAEAVLDCFVEDGIFHGRIGRFVGREELRQLVTAVKPPRMGRHVISNTLILPNADGSARVKSLLLYFEAGPGGIELRSSGVYNDVVVKQAEEWRFHSRIVDVDPK